MDEQQRVVAGRAEHQHDEDRGRQRAHREPGVGEAVRASLGDDDGPYRTEQREQPQERAAVDQQEDHHDDRQGGEPEVGLHLVSDATVGDDCRRTGHRDVQAVVCAVRGGPHRLPDRLNSGGVVGRLAVRRRGDGRGEVRGRPVGRWDGLAGRAQAGDGLGQPCHGRVRGSHRGPVSGRQTTVAGENHDHRIDVGLAGSVQRGLLELDDLRRVGRGREVGRGAVAGHAGQAAGQRVERHDGQQPDDHDRPAQPAQRPAKFVVPAWQAEAGSRAVRGGLPGRYGALKRHGDSLLGVAGWSVGAAQARSSPHPAPRQAGDLVAHDVSLRIRFGTF